MPRLARRTRGGFLEDAAVLTAGNLLSQAIWIGSAPVLTRIYEPDAFGVWALFVSIAAALAIATTWRYELAIVLPETDAEAEHITAVCFVIAAFSVGLVTVIVLVLGKRISGFLSTEVTSALFAFIPILMSAAAIQHVCRFMAVRHRRFATVARFLILQASLVVGLQVAFGVSWQNGAVQLLAASATGNLLAALVFVRTVFGAELCTQMKASLQRPQLVISSARLYRNFPLYSAPYSLLSIATQRLLFVLLATFAAAETVGLFGLAMRTVYLPVFVVAGAFSQAFFRRARWSLHGGEVERLVHQVLVYQAMLATPIAILFALNSGPLFAIVFGEQWRLAGSYAGLLTPPALLLFCTAWLDRTYDILGRQRLRLVLLTSYGGTVLVACATCLWLGLGPYRAVATFAGITVVYRVIWAIVTFRIARFSARMQLGVTMRFGALTALTFGVHVVFLSVFDTIGYAFGCFAFMVVTTGWTVVRLVRAAFGRIRPRFAP